MHTQPDILSCSTEDTPLSYPDTPLIPEDNFASSEDILLFPEDIPLSPEEIPLSLLDGEYLITITGSAQITGCKRQLSGNPVILHLGPGVKDRHYLPFFMPFMVYDLGCFPQCISVIT